jgi:hypothetical protein
MILARKEARKELGRAYLTPTMWDGIKIGVSA